MKKIKTAAVPEYCSCMLSYWPVSAVLGVGEEMLTLSYEWKIVMLVILLGIYSHRQ